MREERNAEKNEERKRGRKHINKGGGIEKRESVKEKVRKRERDR